MATEIRPNQINYTDDLKVLITQLNERLAFLTEEINKIYAQL